MENPFPAVEQPVVACSSQLPPNDDIDENSDIISSEEALSDSELVTAVLQRIANENNSGAIIWISNSDDKNATLTDIQSNNHLNCEQLAGVKDDSGYITLQPVTFPAADHGQCNSWPSQTYDISLHDGMAYLQQASEGRGDGLSSGVSATESTNGAFSLLTFSPGMIDLSGNLEQFANCGSQNSVIQNIPTTINDASTIDIVKDSSISDFNRLGMSSQFRTMTSTSPGSTSQDDNFTSEKVNCENRDNNKSHPYCKTRHNANEKWRRTRMKNACALLRELVPGIGKTTEKAIVFEMTARYIIQMKPFVSDADEAKFIKCYGLDGSDRDQRD